MLQKNPHNLSQYDEVKDFVMSKILPLQKSETVSLQALVRRVLAEDIISPLNLPGWPQSAMDGYAFSSQATIEYLAVVDTIYAGESPKQVDENCAVKIMTGALLPAGLDTVVPFEEAMVQSVKDFEQLGSEQLTLEKLLKPTHLASGRHVKSVGSDVQAGQVLLKKGHRLTTRDIGLLASVGLYQASVFRKVKVAILASGDELLMPGQDWQLGKTYDANSYQIAALCADLPVEVITCERMNDDLETVSKTLASWSQKADMILTLGGASAGQKDFIKTTLSTYETSHFWKLAMKPAKPFTLARKNQRSAWVLALPGNPLAAFMSFQLFALEAIRKLAGQADWQAQSVQVKLLTSLPSNPDKMRWLQVIKTSEGVVPMEQGSASQLSLLSTASGYIRLQPNVDYKAGISVTFWSYDCGY